jgi:mono/diheme cytochrome c family protein
MKSTPMSGFDRPRLCHTPLLLLAVAALTISATGASAALRNADDFPSGQQIFQDHCATCHGTDGMGNGPMAQELKTPPADLTKISVRAGGTFPAARVVEIMRYGGNVAGHGSQDMPVWGKVLSSEGGGGKGGAAFSRRAVIELKRYLETIQKKAP